VRWAFPDGQAIRLHLLPDDSDALGHAFFPASAVMDAAGRCISDGMTTTDVFNDVYEAAGGCDWDQALSEVLIERFSGERFAGLDDSCSTSTRSTSPTSRGAGNHEPQHHLSAAPDEAGLHRRAARGSRAPRNA
jgi:hypothetical protein